MNINWPIASVIVVVLAIIGATTYLAAVGVVSGATVVQLFLTILGGIGLVGGVHVTATAIGKSMTKQ